MITFMAGPTIIFRVKKRCTKLATIFGDVALFSFAKWLQPTGSSWPGTFIFFFRIILDIISSFFNLLGKTFFP